MPFPSQRRPQAARARTPRRRSAPGRTAPSCDLENLLRVQVHVLEAPHALGLPLVRGCSARR
eukprot:437511-Rhodomonas_salina.1